MPQGIPALSDVFPARVMASLATISRYFPGESWRKAGVDGSQWLDL